MHYQSIFMTMNKLSVTVLSVALMAGSLVSGLSAQVLKSNLTEGYAVGDVLERQVYEDKKAPAVLDSWSGAFHSSPNELPSPAIVAPLLYPGYPEQGNAIRLGWDKGIKGSRFSCFTVAEDGKLKKGVFYLSAVVRLDRISSKDASELIGLTPNATGGAGKYRIMARRDSVDSKTVYFSCSLGKVIATAEQPCVAGQTVLIVMRVDFGAANVSLFVNPDLSGEEPAPAAVAAADEENTTKWPIRAISLRNRNAYAGAVGGIRLTRSWASLSE